jgi:phenylalanine-4-hydroxylase
MITKQDYSRYTDEDRQVWQLLFDRQMTLLPGLASSAYMEGISKVGFSREKIPNFDQVNEALIKHTGWQLVVVPGLIDNKPFFELLLNKKFPATTWLRKLSELDYLEEPDMFHDVFGHVPLLTNQDFCNFLSGLSNIALEYIENDWAIELISRLYWYTVEFGLIQDEVEGLRIYGAGILSSSGESVYCVGEQPQRVLFNVEEIINTPYIKDKFQEKYFVIDSYRQLYESLPEVARVIKKHVSMSVA